jgi:hypothetical protein
MIVLWLYPLFLILQAFMGENAQPMMAFFLLTICFMVKNMKNQRPSPPPTVTIDPALVGKKRVRVTGHIT